jgi:L-ascorbate metabolism protein UlaG (beta-lactamase superfamily)
MKYDKIKYLTLLCLLLLSESCSAIKIEKDMKQIKAPFDGTRFENIEPFEDKGFFSLLKWRITRDSPDWKEVRNQKFHKPKFQRSEELKLTLIGHSTVLIQINNINILTDPHYSKRSSIVTWAGPKRVIQPAIKISDLPPIDLVLISHNHYDHLDIPTLKLLNAKFSPKVLVGLGNKELLRSNGITNVVEMDWWDKFLFNDIPISFTPTQHWSARGLFDKRKTLWGGFLIEATKKIFFAGDTGYGKVFKQINKKYGAIDVGLIPIGAYEPRWFMKDAHVNPEEAVKIFLDLKLKHGFGIHFGTFKDLTDEPIDKPINDLNQALLKSKVSNKDFIAPIFGKTYNYK